MYPNSEFKYLARRKAPTKDDRPNRRSLDADSDYTASSWDYTSDVSFGWFDLWDISFFIAQKRKHYRNLNGFIFRPLSALELNKQESSQYILISDYFNYTIMLPTESSKVYKLSLKHMTEDQPQLSIELMNLRKMNRNHQNLIKDLERMIDSTIRQRFSMTYQSPLKIERAYDYRYDYVYDFLLDVWESNKHDLKQIEVRLLKVSSGHSL